VKDNIEVSSGEKLPASPVSVPNPDFKMLDKDEKEDEDIDFKSQHDDDEEA